MLMSDVGWIDDVGSYDILISDGRRVVLLRLKSVLSKPVNRYHNNIFSK